MAAEPAGDTRRRSDARFADLPAGFMKLLPGVLTREGLASARRVCRVWSTLLGGSVKRLEVSHPGPPGAQDKFPSVREIEADFTDLLANQLGQGLGSIPSFSNLTSLNLENAAPPDGFVASLSGHTRLVKLSLLLDNYRQGALSGESIATLAGLPQLTDLSLGGVTHSDDDLTRLAPLSSKLKSLELSRGYIISTTGWRALSPFTALEHLGGGRLAEIQRDSIRGFPNLTSLTLMHHWNVAGNVAHPDVIVTSLSHLTGLEKLSLHLNGALSGESIATLAGLPKLTVLSLGLSIDSDDDVVSLAPLSSKLKSLDLGSSISAPGWRALQLFTALEHLSFSNEDSHAVIGPDLWPEALSGKNSLKTFRFMGDADCDDWRSSLLAALGQCPSLERIHIMGNYDHTITRLNELAGLKRLSYLGINAAPVEVDDLPVLSQLPNLESLYLWGLSLEGMRIIATLPLVELALDVVTFGDKGMELLGSLTLLESLQLHQDDEAPNQITHRGLSHLKGLTKLSTLTLQCLHVDQLKAYIMDMLPNLNSLDVDC